MIAIKPVSDLRNYNEVLQDVADESPVFLTKNGRGVLCCDFHKRLRKIDGYENSFF